jgi:hypothetical protein
VDAAASNSNDGQGTDQTSAPSSDGGELSDQTTPALLDGSPSGCPTCADAAPGEQDADGQDADAALGSSKEVCHVTWPQARHTYEPDAASNLMSDFYIAPDAIQVAVDSTGDAYLAISYSSLDQSLNPAITLDLGVASPSYQAGVAIAKVDANCHLLWMRELGGPSAYFVNNMAIALDAASNVTLLGSFDGTVDFSGTTLSTAAGVGADLYFMRLDTNGGVVFTEIAPSDGSQDVDVGFLTVSPGGMSTVAVSTWLVPGPDSGSVAPQYIQYFLQYDNGGSLVAQSSPSTAGPFINQMAADSSGMLWALGDPLDDAGVVSTGAPVLMRLTSTGGVAWTQPTLSSDNADSPRLAAGTGNAIVFAASVGGSFPFTSGANGTETLEAYLPDGASPWSHATDVSFAEADFDQQTVVDAEGNLIVGGDFSGSVATSADGSTTQVGTPSGIGFQAFDSTGHFVSMQTWAAGGSDPERFGAMAVDPQGNVVLAGTTVSTGSFGTGMTSLFLTKLGR